MAESQGVAWLEVCCMTAWKYLNPITSKVGGTELSLSCLIQVVPAQFFRLAASAGRRVRRSVGSHSRSQERCPAWFDDVVWVIINIDWGRQCAAERF